ncbi:DUF7619 domain-containing protein [Flavobacterium sp. SM2513]|uniref:T9SS type A sorting domain-containing protein n=1 Tax=Flavobacterium sp. SM2513 TaxID=3424766 RepID=UPI003D7FA779
MKCLYAILFALLSWSTLQAQIVTIPDANFKNALLNTNCVDTDGSQGFDSDADLNNDGEIQLSEAQAILSLNISNQNIVSLDGISAFSNLQKLYFNDNLIANALSLSNLVNLIEVEGTANLLTSLEVSNLPNLVYLSVGGNDLATITLSGSTNLEVFKADNNNLTALNFQGFPNLITVTCGDNQLQSLGLDGLTNLLYLICYDNNLTALDVSDSPSLIDLNCSNNLIENLNITNLNSLTAMDVSNNALSQLDLGLNTQIDALRCQNNQIQSLDVSNLAVLIVLECQNNALTNLTLGSLPALETLNCSFNQLVALECAGAPNLTEVKCSANAISSLDFSTLRSLTTLYCAANQLEFLILKNGIVENTIDFSDNPNIVYVCSDAAQFATIQALLNTYNYSSCVLNDYCSFVPGGEYYSLSGETRFDLDANGCSNLDGLYPFIKIKLTTTTGFSTFISNADGFYSIPLQTGNYTITPVLENLDYFTITPATSTQTITNANVNQDFCIVAEGEKRDLEIVLVPLSQARPGFDVHYKLVYKNKGNLPLTGSISLNFQGNLMDLVVANPAVDTESATVLTWNYTNLLPFQTREIDFIMNLNTPTNPTFPLNGGAVLNFSTLISPVNTDYTPADNAFTLNQTVVNSLDPNDKQCLEGATIEAAMVGKYVHYLVRFENTGTANAINVVLKDEIDTAKFDISTLIPLSASHSFTTRIENTNEVLFIFENIDLPFDDATNDGYVLFKIKTLPTLAIGNTFSNDVAIYFDYNFPILTNDFVTTVIANNLSNTDFENSAILKLYPNPVSDELKITSSANIEAAAIYDVNGRLLQKIAFTSTATERSIDFKQFAKGVYFLQIQSENKVVTRKLIKE